MTKSKPWTQEHTFKLTVAGDGDNVIQGIISKWHSMSGILALPEDLGAKYI